jgi:hypothetical protein
LSIKTTFDARTLRAPEVFARVSGKFVAVVEQRSSGGRIAMCSIKRSIVGVVVSACMMLSAAAAGQTPASSAHPYGLDPYKPSDAAWLRNYGAVLVTQTPLLEVAALDPYNPTQAALIRQLGGAIPVWFSDWFLPRPFFGGLIPPFAGAGFPMDSSAAASGISTAANSRSSSIPTSEPSASVSNPLASPGPTSVATLNRPAANDGFSIRFGGRVWINAGRAVPLEAARFTRIGEYAGSPVYKRTDLNEDVIYVPTRTGDLIAPFRAKP